MTLHHRLEILIGLSFLLSFFSWGKIVLFPFQIFTTWVHECCHAITALLLGARSIKITLASNGSGLTFYKIPNGRIRHALIASAGYLGASAIGCLIFLLAINTEPSARFFGWYSSRLLSQHSGYDIHTMVMVLCTCVALSLVFWIRNVFGFLSLLVLGLGLSALNYLPASHYVHEVLLFLGIQTGLNALFNIRTLFSLRTKGGGAVSDAHTLQKLFFLPHYFWALLWLGLSLFMMYGTVKASMRW